MTVFGAYSHYYDLLYRDKDYAGEARYLDRIIRRRLSDAKTVLDLGCGTGKHALLLSEMGYEVTGIDRSGEMLAMASSRVSPPGGPGCNFVQGDIRTIRLDRTFDVVLSMFHVMSYQVTDADLLAACATASHHLKPGGIFIFDCWYGPGVLTDRPAVRVKRLEDEKVVITRIAEPVIHPNDNLVEVDYQVFVRDKTTGRVEELRETHRMRYLFRPEIESFLATSGLALEEAAEWMTGRAPGFDTWGVWFQGRK